MGGAAVRRRKYVLSEGGQRQALFTTLSAARLLTGRAQPVRGRATRPAGFGERGSAYPARRQRSLQYFTCGQSFAHLRRQLNGRWQTGQILLGKSALARRRGMGRLSGGGGCGRRRSGCGWIRSFRFPPQRPARAGRPPGRGRCRAPSLPQTSGCRRRVRSPIFRPGA